MVTLLGVVFLLLTVASLLVRPPALVVVVAAGVAFPHSAAVVVGNASLSCFHLVALVALGRLAFLLTARPEMRARLGSTALRLPLALLGVFAVYGILSAALGPALFHGIAVYSARGGIDQQATRETPLGYSISNAAQVVYVVLDIAALLLIAAEGTRPRHLFDVSVATGSVLGLVCGLLPGSFVDPLLDTMTNVSYFTQDPRLRGTFSEASMLGLFLLAALAYLLASIAAARGRRLVIVLGLLVVTVVDLVLNRSGTVLLALPVTVGVAAVTLAAVWVARGRRPLRRGLPAAAVLLVVAGLLVSPLGRTALTAFTAKSGTASFANRTRADGEALLLAVRTFGLGAGLGSNRSSSLVPTLLSTVGVIGTAALLGAIVLLVVRLLRRDLAAPEAWATVGALAGYATSVPDLSLPLLWVLGGLLLMRLAPLSAQVSARRGRHAARPA